MLLLGHCEYPAGVGLPNPIGTDAAVRTCDTVPSQGDVVALEKHRIPQ